MEKYTNYLKKTPIELFNEARADIKSGLFLDDRSIKDDLNGFRRHLKNEGLSPLSVKAHMAGVKSFFKSFGIEIPKSPRSEATALPLKENSKIPKKEDLQEVLKVCDPLEKAIILTEVASGLSAQEMINLKLSDFNNGYDSETGITTLELRREKVQFDFTTFLTPEASSAVLEYLDYRNRKTSSNDKRRIDQVKKQNVFLDEGYLFIVRLVPNEFLQTGNEELRKIDEPSFLMMYRIISEKARKSTAKGKWNKIRSHNLRKYFSFTLLDNGLDIFHVDHFMGHKPNNSRAPYSPNNPKKLKEIYKKYIPYLTIQKDLDISESPEYLKIKNENQILRTETERHVVERQEFQELRAKDELKNAQIQQLRAEIESLKRTEEDKKQLERKWDKIIGCEISGLNHYPGWEKDYDEHNKRMSIDPKYAEAYDEYMKIVLYDLYEYPDYEKESKNYHKRKADENTNYNNRLKTLLDKL